MALTFALAQSNAIVGFIDANLVRITALYEMAVTVKADLVIFPEMVITGYPLEDLALNKQFQTLSMEALEKLAHLTRQGTAILIGGLWREGSALYNTAFLMDGGKIIHKQYKHHLPNYGVFDEKRIFASGPLPKPVLWRGLKLGLLICEDMWRPDLSAHLKREGAEMLISTNASPFEIDKASTRDNIAICRVQETGLPLIYVNLVGGQDELVFDGASFVLSAQGKICTQLASFREDFAVISWENNNWTQMPELTFAKHNEEEAIYYAAALGLKDFVEKNGFAGVLIGMSGGIDSALSAAIAVDALGKDRVRSVMLPSPVTSAESVNDAKECAERLGIRLDTISIDAGMQGFNTMLSAFFEGNIPAVTTENNQPRLRSSILMAISHKERLLLLNTGNKSEMATGYTTLYGDMCGHYSVLKDIYKTTIYKLAHWRNSQSDVIPENILTKAPSAELHSNQKDQDTLPPYELLDAILLRLVEKKFSIEEIIAEGFERDTVVRVSHMLFASEFKRRQSCPGVKISGMAFYRDRRYPLTSGWRGMKFPLSKH